MCQKRPTTLVPQAQYAKDTHHNSKYQIKEEKIKYEKGKKIKESMNNNGSTTHIIRQSSRELGGGVWMNE